MTITEPHLRKLAEKYFVEDTGFIAEFKQHSAAKSVHHAFVGGFCSIRLQLQKYAVLWRHVIR